MSYDVNGWGCTGHVPANTGERYGHCGQCHRDFMGLTAFDKHRRGPMADRRCVDPATDDERTATGAPIADWWQDDKGRWHEGARGEFWGRTHDPGRGVAG